MWHHVSFDTLIQVKVNAVELLRKELALLVWKKECVHARGL